MMAQLPSVRTPDVALLDATAELHSGSFTSPIGRIDMRPYQHDIAPDVVIVELRLTGDHIGQAYRRLRRDEQGRLVADHSHMHLRERYQRRGIATAMLAEMVGRYRDCDVHRVEVGAKLAGGYAMARLGFLTADRDQSQRVCDQVLARVYGDWRQIPDHRNDMPEFSDPEAVAETARWLAYGDPVSTIWQLADLGRGSTNWWHDGQLALWGTHWRGLYIL